MKKNTKVEIAMDIKRLKNDLLLEVVLHQNGDETEKACNRGSCHLNKVFDRAAKRQKNPDKYKEYDIK